MFEAAILAKLRELKPGDVVGKVRPSDDAVEVWSGKLAAVNHNIVQTQQRAAKADDPTVFLDLLETYAADRKTIIARLEQAKAEAVSPAGDILGECSSLAEMLASADEGEERDELRRRVKASLRRLVDGIWLLVATPKKKARVAAARVQFRGQDRHRDYAIWWQDAEWSVRSLADAGLPISIDLRDPKQAARLEAAIARAAKTLAGK